MSLRTIANVVAAATTAATITTAAMAATVSYNGTEYEITTVTGKYSETISADMLTEIADTLSEQVWWGNSTLAREFASLLGDELNVDVDTDFSEGPIFAYGDNSATATSVSVLGWQWETVDFVLSPSDGVTFGGSGVTQTATYAVATAVNPVPLPASSILVLSGIAGLVALKRRRKHSK